MAKIQKKKKSGKDALPPKGEAKRERDAAIKEFAEAGGHSLSVARMLWEDLVGSLEENAEKG